MASLLSVCAICRNELSDQCVECQADPASLSCHVSTGQCQHRYHSHCIQRWLQSRDGCPLCNTKWSVVESPAGPPPMSMMSQPPAAPLTAPTTPIAKFCPFCGQHLTISGARFCASCGKPQPQSGGGAAAIMPQQQPRETPSAPLDRGKKHILRNELLGALAARRDPPAAAAPIMMGGGGGGAPGMQMQMQYQSQQQPSYQQQQQQQQPANKTPSAPPLASNKQILRNELLGALGARHHHHAPTVAAPPPAGAAPMMMMGPGMQYQQPQQQQQQQQPMVMGGDAGFAGGQSDMFVRRVCGYSCGKITPEASMQMVYQLQETKSSVKKLKVVFLGAPGVGKTTMCKGIQSRAPVPEGGYMPTIFDSFETSFRLGGRHYSLSVWDVSCAPDFARLRPLAYQGTDVFIMCIDLTNKATSALHAISLHAEVMQHCSKPSFVLVGTKLDAKTDDSGTRTCQRLVEDGGKLKKTGFFVEASARTGQNMNDLLGVICAAAFAKKCKKKKKHKGEKCLLM